MSGAGLPCQETRLPCQEWRGTEPARHRITSPRMARHRTRHRTGEARDYLAKNGKAQNRRGTGPAQDQRLCHYRREGEGVDIRGRHSVIIDFGRPIASKPLCDSV